MEFFSFFAIVLLGGLVALFVRTHAMENKPEQAEFLKGTAPAALPVGLLKGSVPGMANPPAGWIGKEIGADGVGKNILEKDGKRTAKYPFRMVRAKGLRDAKDVLVLDYNQPGNPFWLRAITDEVVETTPGKYLGKVHVRILPGIPFTLAFFRLEQ